MLRRALIGLTTLTVLAACGGGTPNAVSSTVGSSPSSKSSQTVEFKETEYSLAPATLTLKPGTYTFTIQNLGQFPHDLHVATAADGTEVGGSPVAAAGQSVSFTATFKAGQYTLWCSIDAHRSLGMGGRLTVQ